MKTATTFLYMMVFMSLYNETSLSSEPFSFELNAELSGKYIWRGQNISDDPVFQSALAVSYENWTTAVWGNIDLTNINGNSGDFSELDYALDYTAAFEGLEGIQYSAGVIYYEFPGTKVKDTTEVYWAIGCDLPLNPSITVYHDLDEAEGTYICSALKYSTDKVLKLGDDMFAGLDIGASLGWASGSYNKYYWGTEQSKFQDLSFKVAFPVELAGWEVTPGLNYVTLLSDDIRDTDIYASKSDFFYASVEFTKFF